MSRLETSDITINNVYEYAYDIAQEFEKIVLQYGLENIKPVVDKVIKVLEVLESSIRRNEELEDDLRTIKANNFQLSSEKIVSDHEKEKLKQIFEENEESWLQEVLNLKSELSSLKSENDLLKSHLAVKKECCSTSDDSLKSAIEAQENTIYRLRRALKQKEKQLQDNMCNINSLNSRIQELLEINKLLHIKNQEVRNEISQLVTEKNDCKSELILAKKENLLLSESIDELVQSNSNKEEDCARKVPNEFAEYMYEESSYGPACYPSNPERKLLKKIKRLQAELHSARLKSLQTEDKALKLNIDRNQKGISKIHQFFHLFLGVTTVSEICWF